MHMVYLLDEAHGDEFVAYHVPGMERPCQFPVEARVFRFDILLYDFRLKVLLALCAVVGTGAFLFFQKTGLPACPGTQVPGPVSPICSLIS